MLNAISDRLNRKPFRSGDSFLKRLAIGHDAGQLECFGNPASVFFSIELDRDIHAFSIAQFRGPTTQGRRRNRAPITLH